MISLTASGPTDRRLLPIGRYLKMQWIEPMFTNCCAAFRVERMPSGMPVEFPAASTAAITITGQVAARVLPTDERAVLKGARLLVSRHAATRR